MWNKTDKKEHRNHRNNNASNTKNLMQFKTYSFNNKCSSWFKDLINPLVIIVLLTSSNLIGCISTKSLTNNTDDGLITSVNIDSVLPQITDDIVQFLAQEYAPAKTRFNFITATQPNDQFGINLKNKLRLKGFEISEKLDGSQYNNLKYLLDNNAQLIRVLIIIDNRNYSRCYSFSGEPISNWTLIKK